MVKAFCRVQNCPPDDSTVCVIVMRSDVNMSPDAESREMMYEDYSLNVADINLLDFPSCYNQGMMGKSMLKKKFVNFQASNLC